MSEYLDQTPRTEEEASADVREAQAKILLATANRIIKLTEQMPEAGK